jgi:lipopolysaccharide biosynthesis protein
LLYYLRQTTPIKFKASTVNKLIERIIMLGSTYYLDKNSITQINSLDDLLVFHDEAFVHAAYRVILGRDPDTEGFKHYLNLVRQGVNKLEILSQLRASKEGRKYNAKLAGLNKIPKWNLWRGLSYIGSTLKWQFIENAKKLRAIENQLFILNEMNEKRFDEIEQILIGARNQVNFLPINSDQPLNTFQTYRGTPDFEPISDSFSANNVEGDFDADWYLNSYPDVAATGMDPSVHYMIYGKIDGRFRNHAELIESLFDADWYLKTYVDVAAAGMDPLKHYIKYGRVEGTLSGYLELSLFDPEWYLKKNPDVEAAGIDPLEHYIINGGRVQGRPYSSFKGIDTIEAEPLVYSEPLANTQVNLIAFYLPQFHPIPENDKWWGKGFTEWTNVSRVKPFYKNHEQPRLPGELGFYDLRLVEVMKRQAELARAHGIHGFCFYIYWFGGKRLLESPVEMLLRHPEIDINFCYCWANENWTRRWDGLDNDVLIGQSHSVKDDIAFISSISTAFSDKRYIRVNNKPMLVVYRPSLFPNIKATIRRWRNWCRKNGIGEIHVCCTASFDKNNPVDMGLDAAIEFPPASIPVQEITHQIQGLDDSFTGQVHNYLFSAKSAKSYIRPKWLQYRGVMPSWDNTPRKMERGISFYGATPELYAEWLDTVVAETKSNLPAEHRIVFINAWNEWGEGAYLEPDRRRGYAYLNHTREVMSKYSDSIIHQELLTKKRKKTNEIAVIIHLYYGDLLDDVARYLDNFSGKADLYFSVRDGCFPEMVDAIRKLYPDAVIVSYPNHGRDVLPFLYILSHIIDFGYEAICKIHSKKSKHRSDGDHWRDDVFNKLLGDKDTIAACLSRIKKGAGIVAPRGHLLDSSNYWGANAKRVTALALKMGCPLDWVDNFFFPAGTMFWFAPQALKALMKLDLQPCDFEAEAGQVDGTTAHAVERLIGLSAMKDGFKVEETIDKAAGDHEEDYPFAAKT